MILHVQEGLVARYFPGGKSYFHDIMTQMSIVLYLKCSMRWIIHVMYVAYLLHIYHQPTGSHRNLKVSLWLYCQKKAALIIRWSMVDYFQIQWRLRFRNLWYWLCKWSNKQRFGVLLITSHNLWLVIKRLIQNFGGPKISNKI